MNNDAMITGVTGQDGSYLAEHLLETGEYRRVIGVARRTSCSDAVVRERLGRILKNPRFLLVQGDVTDPFSIRRLVREHAPGELYNLAAQSHVGTSFEQPRLTFETDCLGVLNLLETIREFENEFRSPGRIRFYQASSSEMFGAGWTACSRAGVRRDETRGVSPGSPAVSTVVPEGIEPWQDEHTPMLPVSPYGTAKLAAHRLCGVYRESYGMFVACGILFNHESPRRGVDFVTRKIARHAALFRARNGDVAKLPLGDPDASRDWGWAPDYVRAMRLMLTTDEPRDFVVATGETRTVRDFLHAAFAAIGESPETAEASVLWKTPGLLRPRELPFLRGRADEARRLLSWKPSVSFAEMVAVMVEHELIRGLCV